MARALDVVISFRIVEEELKEEVVVGKKKTMKKEAAKPIPKKPPSAAVVVVKAQAKKDAEDPSQPLSDTAAKLLMRPKSDKPSKRVMTNNAGVAIKKEELLPWDFDLRPPDRQVLLLEKDEQISKLRYSKENKNKAAKPAQKTPVVVKGEPLSISTRNRPVKNMQGPVYFGNGGGTSSPHGEGVHERAWDDSLMTLEKQAIEYRALPAVESKVSSRLDDRYIDRVATAKNACLKEQSLSLIPEGFELLPEDDD